MSHICILCPRCDTTITIVRVDSSAKLRCLTCDCIFTLKNHLDVDGVKWLRRMSTQDYLTLGDGLPKVEGADVLASVNSTSQLADADHRGEERGNVGENDGHG